MAIELVGHDATWTASYERGREELLQTLAAHTSMAIEHIGSTALPDIVAKPVIDMVVGIRDVDAAPTHARRLMQIGYREWFGGPGRVTLRRDPTGTLPAYHLHIVTYGGETWSDLLCFRNWLLEHVDERMNYEALKKALAVRFSDSRQYSEAKSLFVKRVVARARGGRAPSFAIVGG